MSDGRQYLRFWEGVNRKDPKEMEKTNIVGTLTCEKGYVLANENALTPDCKSVKVACKFDRYDGTLWRPWVDDGKIHAPAQCKRGIDKVKLFYEESL